MKFTRLSSIHDVRHQRLIGLLVKARNEAGISQTELAHALGLKQPDISKIENNERRLDVIEFLDVVTFISIRCKRPSLVREIINQILEGTRDA
ncbi:helix-turn-helix transcriptional regulator [Herbaspirillum rhizosphaerae]|uniref:Helix-turn-helix transcriptional regulator n=1 Tax=Herbaspirillum rhizosphaerae TaxID=346179 RepID=A0ABW8Z2G7_9BURK